MGGFLDGALTGDECEAGLLEWLSLGAFKHVYFAFVLLRVDFF